MALEEVGAGPLVQMNATVALRHIELCDAGAAASLRPTDSAILLTLNRRLLATRAQRATPSLDCRV
jgi:hypothetical protein